jgi:hypothetical protein
MDEQARKRLVRIGIVVFGVLTALLVVASVMISRLPPPGP